MQLVKVFVVPHARTCTATLWAELARRKLDSMGLSEEAVSVSALYSPAGLWNHLTTSFFAGSQTTTRFILMSQEPVWSSCQADTPVSDNPSRAYMGQTICGSQRGSCNRSSRTPPGVATLPPGTERGGVVARAGGQRLVFRLRRNNKHRRWRRRCGCRGCGFGGGGGQGARRARRGAPARARWGCTSRMQLKPVARKRAWYQPLNL
jgi:hypothetical protein